MITFRFEETIARPAEDIWALAADIERHPSWMGVSDARLLHGRPTETGARGREVMKLGPRRYDFEFEVSDAQPGRRIAWRIIGGGPLRGEVALELEPVGSTSTRAVYRGTLSLLGLWRLLEPLMAAEARRGPAAELQRLKGILEAERPPIEATA